ncbi:hypothetical protein SK128_016403, partial [Halocaridina rubra]
IFCPKPVKEGPKKMQIPIRPAEPSYTSEQILDWGQTSDIWLPAVEAVEQVNPWNPPPPIHVMTPGAQIPPRPSYVQPELQTHRPRIQPEVKTQRPRVHVDVKTQRPRVHVDVKTQRPRVHVEVQAHRPYVPPVDVKTPLPYRPVVRRPKPPSKLRRRYYYPRYRPKNQGPLYLDSHELRQLTRRRPSYRRPISHTDRVFYVDYDDYYDSDYYYDDYYLGDYETYDDEPSSLKASSYFRTPNPYDHPYSYYSYQGSLTGDSPTSTKATTFESTTPITTSTTEATRPTSRYADTISSWKPTRRPETLKDE